jgi:hypothetical protein
VLVGRHTSRGLRTFAYSLLPIVKAQNSAQNNGAGNKRERDNGNRDVEITRRNLGSDDCWMVVLLCIGRKLQVPLLKPTSGDDGKYGTLQARCKHVQDYKNKHLRQPLAMANMEQIWNRWRRVQDRKNDIEATSGDNKKVSDLRQTPTTFSNEMIVQLSLL